VGDELERLIRSEGITDPRLIFFDSAAKASRKEKIAPGSFRLSPPAADQFNPAQLWERFVRNANSAHPFYQRNSWFFDWFRELRLTDSGEPNE
jgi:hypothetical protein